jgi:hypothetical protein
MVFNPITKRSEHRSIDSIGEPEKSLKAYIPTVEESQRESIFSDRKSKNSSIQETQMGPKPMVDLEVVSETKTEYIPEQQVEEKKSKVDTQD